MTKLIFRLNNPLTRDARCSLRKTLPDVAHFIFRLFRAAGFDQNLFGALRLPYAKQPARTFRHGKKKEEIKRRRNGIHAQHPAPIVFPDIQQKVVGERRTPKCRARS